MRAMNLANAAKRDAQIAFTGAERGEKASWVLPDGTRPATVRFVKSTTSIDALVKAHGSLEGVAQAIIEGDPDVDIEAVGKLIGSPLRLYVDGDGNIAYRVRMEEIVYGPDGVERERREPVRTASNIAAETPIQWSKRSIPKDEAIRRFVFSRSYQLVHTNGLTFDFLYQMAADLHRDKALRLVGSGPHGTGPIVLNTGGEPYRGFLEGRVDGERYSLVLHLSNQELRPLPTGESA